MPMPSMPSFGEQTICPGAAWSTLWGIAMVVLAIPLSFCVIWVYVLLLPFGACFEPVKEVNDLLLKVVQSPYTCSKYMMQQKSCLVLAGFGDEA